MNCPELLNRIHDFWSDFNAVNCWRSSELPPAAESSGYAGLPETSLMKSQRRLQKISAGISLVILSLGFSLLGLLSFVNKPHADLANVPCVASASRENLAPKLRVRVVINPVYASRMKLMADHYSDADFIMLLDSDHV
jgi:hypothetical protein